MRQTTRHLSAISSFSWQSGSWQSGSWQSGYRLEAPLRGKEESKGAMNPISGHHSTQRFGREHHAPTVQTAGHNLPNPPLVMSKAGFGRKLQHNIDTRHAFLPIQ
ncbi:hypothetical protein [Billgrantia diversa]|uniref:hypothetical protein n=1 Tax=Halomonas sp. MCCC 1A13316 TaxID=2733487 RepID=UPI003FA600DB